MTKNKPFIFILRVPFHYSHFDFLQQNLKVQRLMMTAFPAVMLIGNLGILAVILWGGAKVMNLGLTVGELVAFSNYLMTALFPMMMLGMIIAMLPAADASARCGRSAPGARA